MSKKRILLNSILLMALVLSLAPVPVSAALDPSAVVASISQQSALGGIPFGPYRVLVVAGTQMRDDYVIHNASDFGDIVALLKLWGVPFDILRLDTHSMVLSDFVDGGGQARYGAIIWTARQDKYGWQEQDYNVLAQAVNNYHISLIAVGDRIREPVIQGLLGLTYEGWGPTSYDVMVNGSSHFITRDLAGTTVPASEAFPGGGVLRVAVAAPDVDVLATAGTWPQLTARTVDADNRTRAVWIGGHHAYVFYTSPTFIELLQRSLVWAMGYGLYKDYGHSVVLRMDDPGGAPSAYLGSWHYQQLSQTTIQNSIRDPLQSHSAKLGVGFNAGYPWIPTHSITHSVGIDFIDPYGTPQNIVSTYAGLLDGIAAGVLEVQSHGLTHMVPDLDTPISGSTNWWDGSIGGEWDVVGWYREFRDTRRDADVDAPTQTAHLIQSADWTEDDFGERPLAFIPGGHVVSGDDYEGGWSGTITVTIVGATPDTGYTTYYGGPSGWLPLGGTLTTDSSGDVQGVFEFPPSILYTTGTYFTVNRQGSGTQFIGGPVVVPLGYNFSFDLRDYTDMTAAELLLFNLADETLDPGSDVVGNGAYTPPYILDRYTYKLAGEAEYGLALDTTSHYLGEDYVITLRVCTTDGAGSTSGLQDDFNRGVPAVSYFHDRDIAGNANYLSNWLDTIDATWTDVYYLSMDEWTGYMHAQLGATAPTTDSVQFDFTYDSHYCRYFDDHPSTWTLHLSDELLDDFQTLGEVEIIVDGAVAWTGDAASYFSETQELTVPVGVGTHTILFRFEHCVPVSIEIAPAGETVTAGESVTYTATAQDACGPPWDVTPATAFSIVESGHGGSWAGNVYTSHTAGDWTVRGSYSRHTDDADLTVEVGELSDIVISPGTATIGVGEVQTYTAEAFDAYGNSLGDVTAATAFSIVESGHGGSWAGNVYTSHTVGEWTVRGSYGVHSDDAHLSVVELCNIYLPIIQK